MQEIRNIKSQSQLHTYLLNITVQIQYSTNPTKVNIIYIMYIIAQRMLYLPATFMKIECSVLQSNGSIN